MDPAENLVAFCGDRTSVPLRLQEKGVVPHGLVTGPIPEAKLLEFQDNPKPVVVLKGLRVGYGGMRVRSLEDMAAQGVRTNG